MAIKVDIHKVLEARARGGGIELRHPSWAEFDAWAALRRANEEFLSPWEPEWNLKHITRGSYRMRLSKFKKMVAQDRGYPFHIFRKDDGRFIGACNITNVQRHAAQSAQIGYWLGESYARQGFARAAVNAVTLFCFENLGLHRVEAAVQPNNTRSIKLLKAIDFALEGTARGYLKINGQWQDHDVYARLSSD